MIFFSNAKINLGLNIVNKRPDGFHNIESIFYPIPWYDIIEIIPNNSFELKLYGLQVSCTLEQNLCFKAFQLMKQYYNIPNVKIVLYKNIPEQAGLGGGSSNATHTLIGLNQLFDLNLTKAQLSNLANNLGSDCAYFVENTPALIQEKGNKITPLNFTLANYYLAVLKTNISVSTAWAYQQVIPHSSEFPLAEIILNKSIEEWKNFVSNDFEKPVFKQFPELKQLKEELYRNGALYASMSGSGSSIYGIFKHPPLLPSSKYPHYWCKKLI